MGESVSVVDEYLYTKYPDNPPPWFIADRIYPLVRVPDHFLHCVVFIGTYTNDRFAPCGTGFCAVIEQEGMRFQHVITARHVIDGIPGDVYLRVNLKGGGFEVLKTLKKGWILANDPSGKIKLDIAALPANIPAEKYEILNVDIADDLSEELIEKLDIGIGDDVFFLGLHISHFGQQNNVPVVRMGTIAAISEEPYETGIGYVEGYLIEVRSIGGSSGSPVFLSVPPLKVMNGKVSRMEGKPAYFFGMICGTWYTTNPTDAIGEEEVAPKDKPSVENIITGIAIMVPSFLITALLNMPGLVAERKALIEKKRKEAAKNFRFSSAKPKPQKEAELFPTGDDILKAALNMPPKPHKGEA